MQYTITIDGIKKTFKTLKEARAFAVSLVDVWGGVVIIKKERAA